jgi:integrase
MSGKSTTAKRAGKSKPVDKPPFRHQSGRWAKKVKGQFVYLGSIADDPDGERAQRVWNEQCHGIRAGRKPILDDSQAPEGVTVKELCDRFLAEKQTAVENGELAQRSWQDYFETCLRVADTLTRRRLVSDLTPADFAHLRASLAFGRGLVTLKNEIARVRVMFRWGFESELLENAARFGAGFKPPSAKNLRVARAEKGPRCFDREQLVKVLGAVGVQIKAMVLLGINCGLGNSDCARLRFGHVDLKAGWLDFPRPKTGEPRRAKLWPETVAAVKAAIDTRPAPSDPEHGELLFVTKYGRPWREDSHRNSPLSHEFAKVLDELGLKRPGLNFYALRHTLQTVGEGALDKAALARIMGHVADARDMSATYREHVADERLEAVAKFVRKWLFPPAVKKRKPR